MIQRQNTSLLFVHLSTYIHFLIDDSSRVMKNVIKSPCLFLCPHLDIYPVEFQRPLSEIDPDRCLGVLQESTPAESVRQTRLSNIGITYDNYLKNTWLNTVIIVVWGELQGAVQTDNSAEILPLFVFYCHFSCSRGLDANSAEISREHPRPMDFTQMW